MLKKSPPSYSPLITPAGRLTLLVFLSISNLILRKAVSPGSEMVKESAFRMAGTTISDLFK